MNSKLYGDMFTKALVEAKHIAYAHMETAMAIQEVFDDMMYAHHLNPDKVDSMDAYDRRAYFIEWVCEFEDTYKDTSEYEDNFEETIKEFAEKKLMEMFGNEEVS